jgi:hypothetical protein
VATTDPSPTDYPPPRPARTPGRTLSVVAFVLAGFAVLLAPPLLGLAAIILGIIAHGRGDPLGRWAAVAGLVGAIVGTLIAVALLSSSEEALAVLLRR